MKGCHLQSKSHIKAILVACASKDIKRAKIAIALRFNQIKHQLIIQPKTIFKN